MKIGAWMIFSFMLGIVCGVRAQQRAYPPELYSKKEVSLIRQASAALDESAKYLKMMRERLQQCSASNEILQRRVTDLKNAKCRAEISL
jgi:hypothetical protein